MPKKTQPDYRKELEKSAKQMILIHRVDTLIRIILRAMMRNLKIKHAGLLLYDKDKNEYVAKVSRGKSGGKIPAGFAKVGKNNALIRYFADAQLRVFGSDYLSFERISTFLNSKKGKKDKKVKAFLEDVKFQLSLYNAKFCIPGFFRDKLICIFFLGQKSDRRKFTAEELGFLSVLSSDAVMAIQNAWFYQDLNKQLQLNRNLFLQTVMALATAIEAKDKYTSGHTERVSRYSLSLAEEIRTMQKINRRDWVKLLRDLKIAASLHDIGKIGVKEAVLNKPGILTDAERKDIEKHTLVGFSILKSVDRFREPILGVKYHHERYDGKGYPEGLKGNKIPLIAQIISAADTYDAMTTDRPYRKALSKEKALEAIKENRGKQFSPLIVDVFVRAYKKGKFEIKDSF